jgi:membrane fusion protein, heavy metal efflux system
VTLEPRREGPVTFVLRPAAGPPVEHVEPAPARAGIYIPELTFPEAGEWSVSLRIPIEGVEDVVELPKLVVYPTKQAASEAPEPEAPEGISFLKEQQWKILSKTEPVERRRMIRRLRLPALVAAAPGGKALVLPPVAGRLQAPPGKALPGIGARVEAGDVLALVQPPMAGGDLLAFAGNQQQLETLEMELTARWAEAEANIIRARAAHEQATQTLARTKKLFEQQAKSKRELEEAEFAQTAAKANLDAAQALKKPYDDAKARLDARPRTLALRDGFPGLELAAPISGTVAEVGATVGEHVSADRVLFRILDTGSVHVEARIPETDLGRLGSSWGATYEAPDAPGRLVPILGEGGGRFVVLGQEVDARTRTLPLVYEVPNPEGRLRIGMALSLALETDEAHAALAIPESAVVEEEGRPVGFVQLSGEAFEKRDLELGIRDSGFVEVLAGLAEGERVVTKGAYAVRLASVSTTIPAHGHAH